MWDSAYSTTTLSHSTYQSPQIVKHLQQLTREGMTILCTIHQPSSEVFHVFDKLLLLSRGHTVYFGDNKNAIPYFAKLGYPAPQFSNPADFFMTLINTDFEDAKTGAAEDDVQASQEQQKCAKFAECFKKSIHYNSSETIITEIEDGAKAAGIEATVIPHAGFSAGFFTQFGQLLKRRSVKLSLSIFARVLMVSLMQLG